MIRQSRLIRLFSMMMISLTGFLETGWTQSPGTIVTIAGTEISGFSGDGGPATAATLNNPIGVAVDGTGNLYITDNGNYRIRKVDPSGTITTVAGTGIQSSRGDGGPATMADLRFPAGMTVDGAGNLYSADERNHSIRKVTPNGIITTVAGSGAPGFSGDGGPATAALFHIPTSVAMDGMGNLYIADVYNHRIRKVDSQGMITTFAGGGGPTSEMNRFGFSGDGGPATTADLDSPVGVAVDGMGNVYIADYYNHRIRKVDSNGIITTVVGSGPAGPGAGGGFSGDGGPATTAHLSFPTGVAVDRVGNLYIADSGNQRIRRVTPGGVITTVAGNGTPGFGGDGGLAPVASLNFPTSVSVDGAGDLYIADTNDHRIRKVIQPFQALLALSATCVSFEKVETGVFQDTTVTITNLGTDTLRVSDVIVNSPAFTVRPTAFTIPPGQSFTDTLRVTPAAMGLMSGTALVFSNTFGSPDTLTLFALGIPPPWTLPADTSLVTFSTVDSTSVSIQFQAEDAMGHVLTFESFGPDPPNCVQEVPSFHAPLLYFSMGTTLTVFTARVTVQYTDAQLAATGVTDERSLTVAALTPATSTWTLTPTTVDPAANTAMFTTNHLSTWVLASVGPTGIDEPETPLRPPRTFALYQNAPNPFNPETTIRFELPTESRVTLRVYNLLGQEVVTLMHEEAKSAGSHVVRWDGRNGMGEPAASGVYLYRLEADQFVETRKMTLLR